MYMKIATFLFLFASLGLNGQPKTAYVNNSSIAFTVPVKDLMAEDFAFDSRTGDFYFSSRRKGVILKLDASGQLSVFADQDFGLWMTLGMTIDTERGVLWVCTAGGNNLIGYFRDEKTDGKPTGLFEFDLTTGNLLRRVTLEQPEEKHYLSAVVVRPGGEVVVSHMFEESVIYTLPVGATRFKKVLTPDIISFPNGLALSPNGDQLFVAHRNGLARYDFANKKWSLVSDDSDAQGLHGLAFYNNSLIGIHSVRNTVKRFFLTTDFSEVLRIETIEKNHPMMMRPTCGKVVNGEFLYLANPQFQSFTPDGTVLPLDQLFELVVLKTPLN